MTHDTPSRLRRYRAPILGVLAALALVAGASTYSAVSAAPGDPTGPASVFTPIEPIRIFDSRPSLGGGGAIGPEATAAVKVAGPTATPLTNIPANATAVVLNVTAVLPTADAWVAVLPWAAALPSPANMTSNVNFKPDATVANMVTVGLGTDGDGDESILVYNAAGTTDVVVDVFGFYAPIA